MKKIILSLSVACALMACGGAQKQNADNVDKQSAEAVSETPKTNTMPVLNMFMDALPGDFISDDDGGELKAAFSEALTETLLQNLDARVCSASVGNEEGCNTAAIITIYPKKDGKNFFCVAQCGGGCDCWVPSFNKSYNLNVETGKLTEEKPVIEAVDVEEFGPLSADTKKLMAKALADNTLDHSYDVEYDYETRKIDREVVKISYNYDIQEQMNEDDWNNFVVVERFWNGEKFVKKQ